MTQLFTAVDYAKLHSIVFSDDYPGYKPNVVEAPNGDENKDEFKRYAHVAEKYFNAESYHHLLNDYLDKAHTLSLEVAVTLGIPRPFWPVRKYGALRVLEYDSKATTASHTDLDLFTLMLYRNDEKYFKYINRPCQGSATIDQMGAWYTSKKNSEDNLAKAQRLNSQIHFGELLEEILPDQFRANKHEVVASGGPWQYSIVYFAIPDHSAVLPSGITVGKWLEERMKRSRYGRE